jgi:hypothetical protein
MILIHRRSQETAGIAPEAIAALTATYDRPFHNDVHALRAPIGIYNVSLGNLLPRFESVLSAIESVLNNRPFLDRAAYTWDEPFLDAYRILLYSLPEHLEDCRAILKTLFPDSKSCAADYTARAYVKAVEPYRRSVARIVNHMKHKHGRLHSVVSHVGTTVVLEYFVDGVGPDGAIGPAREVHPDGQSAINVWHDLRFHFAHIYIVSYHLSRAVEAIMGEGVDTDPVNKPLEDRLADLASRLSRLPLLLDSDRLDEPLAAVHLKRFADDARTIRICYPEPGVVFEELTAPMLTTARLVGDGVTRSFSFPYMRKMREARARGDGPGHLRP